MDGLESEGFQVFPTQKNDCIIVICTVYYSLYNPLLVTVPGKGPHPKLQTSNPPLSFSFLVVGLPSRFETSQIWKLTTLT